MWIDRAALVAGSIRLASGISFLVDPLRANRLWGTPNSLTRRRGCSCGRWVIATR